MYNRSPASLGLGVLPVPIENPSRLAKPNSGDSGVVLDFVKHLETFIHPSQGHRSYPVVSYVSFCQLRPFYHLVYSVDEKMGSLDT